MLSKIVLVITVIILLKYLFFCYTFMSVYIALAIYAAKRVSKYHIYLWLSAPISAPYILLLNLTSLLTKLDDDSSDS
jgi:uncharacterized membrane protein